MKVCNTCKKIKRVRGGSDVYSDSDIHSDRDSDDGSTNEYDYREGVLSRSGSLRSLRSLESFDTSDRIDTINPSEIVQRVADMIRATPRDQKIEINDIYFQDRFADAIDSEYERLSNIEGGFDNIRVLDVSSNQVEGWGFLARLFMNTPGLIILSMADNNIEEIYMLTDGRILPRTLKILDLSGENFISDLDSLIVPQSLEILLISSKESIYREIHTVDSFLDQIDTFKRNNPHVNVYVTDMA
jgi:hypothetical protein